MKTKKSKTNKKIKRQKLFVAGLLSLVVIMGGYQVVQYINNQEAAEDIQYTAVVFGPPMQQSIEVLMISSTDDKVSVIDNKSSKIQYSDIKNYKEENLEYYQSYHELHPELLDAEVIWRVNTDLDNDFYTNVKNVEDPMSLTVVVNKYNKLNYYFEPDDLVLMENEKQELYLRQEAYDAYLEMKEEIKKQDLKLEVVSAYRSARYQNTLYYTYVDEQGADLADTFSARPGHSGHQTGLVVDVSDGVLDYTDFGKTEAYTWVKDNAHRFGFIVRYKADPEVTGYQIEPWHLRYVGKEIAVDMYEKNIHVLEEYLDKIGI